MLKPRIAGLEFFAVRAAEKIKDSGIHPLAQRLNRRTIALSNTEKPCAPRSELSVPDRQA
jgi:hypothetical protein